MTARLSMRSRLRCQLLGHLEQLGAADPERRAEAALAASEMMRQQGLEWRSLLPPAEGVKAENTPPDWRSQVMVLAHHADTTAAEQAFLLKIAGWRAPGADGTAQIRAVAKRLGVEV